MFKTPAAKPMTRCEFEDALRKLVTEAREGGAIHWRVLATELQNQSDFLHQWHALRAPLGS